MKEFGEYVLSISMLKSTVMELRNILFGLEVEIRDFNVDHRDSKLPGSLAEDLTLFPRPQASHMLW